MNDLFYAHNDQSALNNFITDATWSDDGLDEARYRVILEGLKRRKNDCEGEAILAMDDTLSRKTGKHMENVGYHFDHAEGRQTLAHDILTTHLIKGRLSIPLDAWVCLKEEQLPEEKKSEFRDKNRVARELIEKAHSRGVPFLYVVGDSWFFCRETAELAASLGKTWVI